MPLLRATNVHKTYRLGRVPVPVLRGAAIVVEPNEFVAILGASGSGKSTLLHILGGLDRPDREPSAEIEFDARVVSRLSARQLDRYRAADVGFVFQSYHLLPELTVLENVAVGAMILHGRLGYVRRRAEAQARACELLDGVGLGNRLRHRPTELSGGERQRVAIARSLINRPRLLLADEPTGNLDRAAGQSVLDLFDQLRSELGLTVVMVTHDEAVASRAHRIVRLEDGRAAMGARPRTGVVAPEGSDPQSPE
ncbi:MAG: ABC transporter ATP-binding protein [Planctomycetota bacterium]